VFFRACNCGKHSVLWRTAPPFISILCIPCATRLIKKKAWPVFHTCHEPPPSSIRELLNAVGSKAQALLVAFQSELCNVGSLPYACRRAFSPTRTKFWHTANTTPHLTTSLQIVTRPVFPYRCFMVIKWRKFFKKNKKTRRLR